MSSELRCWLCGVTAEQGPEVTTLAEAEPRYLPLWPPGGGHEHEQHPPSPAELVRRGDEIMQRILRLLAA
ncbi:hypothetical protein ACGF3C_02275 [Micromonospora sp. NPDC047762]|uniref:hypothetical protein n=1 Tax=Micromonospora sp. NPDC047762 TaxID=3364255 RepID=UPI00371ED168